MKWEKLLTYTYKRWRETEELLNYLPLHSPFYQYYSGINEMCREVFALTNIECDEYKTLENFKNRGMKKNERTRYTKTYPTGGLR